MKNSIYVPKISFIGFFVVILLLQGSRYSIAETNTNIKIYESLEDNNISNIKLPDFSNSKTNISSKQQNVSSPKSNTKKTFIKDTDISSNQQIFQKIPPPANNIVSSRTSINSLPEKTIPNTTLDKSTKQVSYSNNLNFDENIKQSNSSYSEIYDSLDSENKLKINPNDAIEQTYTPVNIENTNITFSKNYRELDLLSCIQLALNNNLDIKISTAKLNREKWKYAESISNLLPNIDLGYSQSRYEGTVMVGGIIPATVTRTSIIPSLIATVQAFKGFQNLFGVMSSSHQYKMSKKVFASSIEDITFQVTESYYNLMRNKAKVLISQKSLESAQEQLKVNTERLTAGVGTKFDVLQSESLVAKSEQDLINDQNNLKLSMVIFANLLGEDLFSELLPIEKTIETKNIISNDITIDDMIDIGLLNRPEVERDKETIKSLVFQRRATFSSYLPQVLVSGGLQGSGTKISNITRNQYISLNFTWTGLDKLGTYTIFKSKEIGTMIDEAKLNLENTIRNIQKDIINSYYTKESSKKLIDSSKTQLVSAQEGLRLAEIRLKAGVGTNLDYISSQLTYTNSQVNWVNSVVEYNLAESKLLKAMGIINPSTLAKSIDKNNLKEFLHINN